MTCERRHAGRTRGTRTALALAATFTAGAWASAQTGGFPIATAPEAEFATTIAYDGTNYLIGIRTERPGNPSPSVQRIGPDGALLGAALDLGRTGTAPGVAFGAGRYLAAWTDMHGPPGPRILACTVGTDGSKGTTFVVSDEPTGHELADVEFAADRFLVTYVRFDPAAPHPTLHGRLVTPEGRVGPELRFTDRCYEFCVLNAASDGAGFLVTWISDTTPWVVRARYVDAQGVLQPSITVNDSPALSNFPVTVAFDGTNFLVLFVDEVGGPGSGDYDVFGQLVEPVTGALVGPLQWIAGGPGAQFLALAASDGTGYVVTWTDGRNDLDGDWSCDPGEATCWDIRARYLGLDGAPTSDPWSVIVDEGNQYVAPVCAAAGTYLMSWVDGDPSQEGGDVFGLFLPTGLLGATFCTALPGSLAWPALLDAYGDPSVSAGDLTLRAAPVPDDAFLFFHGTIAIQLPFGDGFRCVGGGVVRVLPPGIAAGHVALRELDPAASGLAPGTHLFQCWYRDLAAGGAGFNLTDALAIDLAP